MNNKLWWGILFIVIPVAFWSCLFGFTVGWNSVLNGFFILLLIGGVVGTIFLIVFGIVHIVEWNDYRLLLKRHKSRWE